MKLRGYRICDTGWFYKIIFDIVHLNKHDFLIYLLPLPGAINLKYASVLIVALSDSISFVKELLTSGILILILVLFIVLEILLIP